MSVEEVHGSRRSVAERQCGTIGTECEVMGLISASCFPGRNNELEVTVIEPDLAIPARGGQPTVGGKCETVDIVAIVGVAENLEPLPLTVITAQAVPTAKPGRQIPAVRREGETVSGCGKARNPCRHFAGARFEQID